MRVQETVVVTNPIGLHLRAAAQFITLIKKYKCRIWFQRGADLLDARSILCVLQLTAVFGTRLNVLLDGEDAQDASKAVLNFFKNPTSPLSTAPRE
jgi:phosphotransferase system HPr (HPr) family protein